MILVSGIVKAIIIAKFKQYTSPIDITDTWYSAIVFFKNLIISICLIADIFTVKYFAEHSPDKKEKDQLSEEILLSEDATKPLI